MPLRQIDHGSAEYQQMIKLRHEILHKPLKLSFPDEDIEKEKDDLLIAAFDEHKMLGCCVLTAVDKFTIRLRQMAVQSKFQRMGIGASLTFYAENIARDKGYINLVMDAIDAAKEFYERLGYSVSGEKFMVSDVWHYHMEKKL